MQARHLLSVADLDAADIASILDTAMRFKRDGAAPLLAGKTLALVFEKPSLRTRVSFQVAMKRLGGDCIYLSQNEVGLGAREAVKDVARVLGRYVDVIAARTMTQRTVEELAQYAGVPVINALSDTEHPCQALADLLTMREHSEGLAGTRVAFIGDGNNVAASLTLACATAGMHIALATPEGYGVPREALALAEMRAQRAGGSVRELRQPEHAVRDAQFVYTDVWVSMGQEEEAAERREAFAPYCVDAALLARAPRGAMVMHDLPAHRGEEITDEVMESPQFIGFDQAENRLHAEQALLAVMLAGSHGSAA
jgi:ornithine carbamoyltransferase